MKHLSYCTILLFICLALLHSCRAKTDTGLLLQGHEYKLWHIYREDKDSFEWNNLDIAKLNSFWIQYKDVDEYVNDTDRNCEHAHYALISSQKRIYRFQWFKKKRKAPEFLYMDRDGYACMLVLNRETGNFVEKQDAEMTGYWKLKNDSILIINNNRYLYRKTGNNPNTVQIRNLQTGNDIKITDTNFPPALSGHEISWTDKEEKSHRQKWGFGIKKSPLLQGDDCKLWRKEEKFCGTNPLDCGIDIMYEDIDYITRYCYYCQFMYFDRYGRYANLYLTGDKWHIWESSCDEICCGDDVVFTYDWHPNVNDWRPYGNDSTLCGGGITVQILPDSNADTLHLRDLDTNEKLRYIAINLPPKSKNKSSGKDK
jgi:hypothetical protein